MVHPGVAGIPLATWRSLCEQVAGDYAYAIRPPCDARWGRKLRGLFRELGGGDHRIGDLPLTGYGCALGQLIWTIRILPDLVQAIQRGRRRKDPVRAGTNKKVLESLFAYHVAEGFLPTVREAVLACQRDPEMQDDRGSFLFTTQRVMRGDAGGIHTDLTGVELDQWRSLHAMDDLCYLQQVGNAGQALARLLGDPFHRGKQATLPPIIPPEFVAQPHRLQRAFVHGFQLETALRQDLLALGDAGFADDAAGWDQGGAFIAGLAHWFGFVTDASAAKHEGVWYGLVTDQATGEITAMDWRDLVTAERVIDGKKRHCCSLARIRGTTRMLSAARNLLRGDWTDAAAVVHLVGDEWCAEGLQRPCPLLVSLLWRFLARGAIVSPPSTAGRQRRPEVVPLGEAFDAHALAAYRTEWMRRLRATAQIIWPAEPRPDILDQALVTATFLYQGKLSGAPCRYRSKAGRLVADVDAERLPALGHVIQDLPRLLNGEPPSSPDVVEACRMIQAGIFESDRRRGNGPLDLVE